MHDGIEPLVMQVKISTGPRFWIRGYQSRRAFLYPQIGKPSKAKSLRQARCYSLKSVVIAGGLKGIDELLKRLFYRTHVSSQILLQHRSSAFFSATSQRDQTLVGALSP